MAKAKIKKYANIFFHKRILKLGGCERYEVETITKYASLGYEIDFYYVECLNDEWLDLIAQAIGKDHIHKYNGEIIYCDTCFINYDFDGFLENVYADNVVNVIHANFMLEQYWNLHDSPKITKRIAVSKENAKAYKQRFNLKADVCYNPITITEKDKRRVLNLISATRLTREKGRERMISLMALLDKYKIPYIWHIFTNSEDDIKNPNVMYHKPNLDVRPYIANADFCVQLSSSEGYCYTVLESLCLGTPVICTDLPIFKEMGVVNGKNGWVLPLDMSKVPIQEIYENNLKGFKYTPKEDNYKKYLTKNKTKQIAEEVIKIRIKKPFHDLQAHVHYVPQQLCGLKSFSDGEETKPIGEIVEMIKPRAKFIVEEKGWAEYL